MPPNLASANPDLMTPDFFKIFDDALKAEPSMIDTLYSKQPVGPRKDQWQIGNYGTMTDWDFFDDVGSVQYTDIDQGYDVILTHKDLVTGFSVQRKLIDDELHSVFNGKPKAMGLSYARTKESHGARLFEKAFVTNTLFMTHSEGVALCSNSHTTTTGASTSSGFDNLTTDALSATSVASARIQMRKFKGTQAETVNITPNELWIPVDLEEKAFEITKSSGKVDGDLNNANFHQGTYNVRSWLYMTDTNNWFMCDSGMRNQNVFWIDRVGVEFKMVEEFDTFIHKWRGYSRYSMGYNDHRWCLGAQVS